MRIAVVGWTQRQAGGIEAYIAAVIADFQALGHDVAYFSEVDLPAERPRLPLPDDVEAWCAASIGRSELVGALKRWRPDVIFAHGVADNDFELELPRIAPAVFLAHAYYGVCISGTKTHCLPVVRPCTRALGPGCLALYFPRRCGGRSPVRMMQEYRRAQARRRALLGYRTILTLSAAVRSVYVGNGFAPERVVMVPFLRLAADEQAPSGAPPEPVPDRWELLMAGRFDRLKGGATLIEALPEVRSRLGRPVRLTLAGDGPQHATWVEAAARASARDPEAQVDFAGWLARAELERRYATSHLLVVPSLWPEPLGLVGIEAGRFGLPAVAFDIGGVREWLREGINGLLARADPATPSSLSGAIVTALADADRYAELRRGARWIADRWDRAHHARGVLRELAAAAGRP